MFVSEAIKNLSVDTDVSPATYLIGSTEERFSSVHFHQDAAQGPHIDGQVIGHSQQHFWGTVEATLDVLVYLQRESTVRLSLCPL